MTTPTLGFEENTTLSKPQIALIQLNEAISLFTQERSLAALTIAGAAEEILGMTCPRFPYQWFGTTLRGCRSLLLG